MAEKKPVV